MLPATPRLLLVPKPRLAVETRRRPAAVAVAVGLDVRRRPAVPLFVGEAAQARGGGAQRAQGRVGCQVQGLPLPLETRNEQDLQARWPGVGHHGCS